MHQNLAEISTWSVHRVIQVVQILHIETFYRKHTFIFILVGEPV